ncbi:hypothetical protein E3N88_22088 [Mikania micrantha]|uniref:BHLH domain-containing protein n=1 Tax=Mikania micrantha TaxID=192012 RepID=A0A5N6NB23_9ASTR|nr:hypothetical protein E3N88_22088 [Mikania micrantha]
MALDNMDGHVLQNNSDLPFSSYTLQGCYSYVPYFGENTFYQQHLQGTKEAVQQQPNMLASTSEMRTKTRKTYSRQKAYETDRRRRTRIAAAINALEGLLPHSKEVKKTNVVDKCIDYIKNLQLYMRELSQNRLGGEPTTYQLMYFEGYGHYLVQDNTANGTHQDMLGKLFEANPSEVAKLLESRVVTDMSLGGLKQSINGRRRKTKSESIQKKKAPVSI